MTTLLDKLNLRPQERRLVVMAAAVLAVVLHFWFIQPYFKEWDQTRAALEKAQKTLSIYRTTLEKTNEFQVKLEKLKGEGTGVLAQEQAQGNLLIQRIQAQARDSKVNYSQIRVPPRSSSAKTDEFFEEQTLDLGVNPTGAKELVDFLVAIGNSDLMVRVKELNLNPDPGGFKLMGSMRLVASFQKKSSVGPATVKPGARPDALSSTKP
ncbi:MAG: hypothetical protein DME18_02830 [Verrucomicrobia bacterium]|nr:MAG: hypothetical protein DME18_02830 [Verrucomicrobiota bacterium]